MTRREWELKKGRRYITENKMLPQKWKTSRNSRTNKALKNLHPPGRKTWWGRWWLSWILKGKVDEDDREEKESPPLQEWGQAWAKPWTWVWTSCTGSYRYPCSCQYLSAPRWTQYPQSVRLPNTIDPSSQGQMLLDVSLALGFFFFFYHK